MKLVVLASAMVIAGSAHAQPPACAHWPTTMALVQLKNDGAIDPAALDQTATKATLLAAQPVGRGVYREIYHVTYREKGGRTIEVLTASEASNEECSISEVDVWVISKHLGGK